MKKFYLLTFMLFVTLGVVKAATAGEDADWYFNSYQAADPWGDTGNGQFKTTDDDNLFLLEKLCITESGVNFCVRNNDWSTNYGWKNAEVTSLGTPVELEDGKSGATGWLALPTGIYDVTWNTTNNTIQFDASNTTVTISEVGYATFYSDYSYTMPEGLTGYTISGVTDGVLNMAATYVAGAQVPRWTGVLLKGNAGNYTITYNGSTSDSYTNRLSGSATATTVNSWEGSDGKNVLLYKLADDGTKGLGWYWDSANGQSLNCGANRCYLWLTQTEAGSVSGSARSFIRMFNDVTGVKEVIGKKEDVREAYYDLSGRRVEKPTKGLYIVNGKKIFK